jgi:hypothetical protein
MASNRFLGARLADEFHRPASGLQLDLQLDLQLGLQLGDTASCGGRLRLLAAGQAWLQTAVDAVWASSGVDRLSADVQVTSQVLALRPASSRSSTLRRTSGG